MMQNAIPSIVTEPPPRLEDVNVNVNVKPQSKNPGISVNTLSRGLPTFVMKSPVAPSNAVSPTARAHFNDLPDSVLAVDARDATAVSKFTEGNSLIIDIRPYNTYSASRLANAYNICIPTTLLKRPTYDLLHVTNTSALPRDVKDKLVASNEPLSILVYDANSGSGHISFGLYQTVQKFLKDSRFTVAYLDGGFQDLPDLLKDSSNQLSDATPISPETPLHPQMAQTVVDPNSKDLPSHATGTESSRESSPFLSGFTLPSATASNQKMLMSIKKTLPKIDTSTTYSYRFRLPEDFEAKKDKLPKWLSFFAEYWGSDDQNNRLVSVLSEKFNKLEKSEQIRLSMAISNTNNKEKPLPSALCNVLHSELSSGYCSPLAPCPHCDKIHYTIPKGVEYGYKNRYHNIWPYEHSRVKLISSPSCTSPSSTSKKENGDDYFNANYIKCKQLSKTEYIATQSPLEATKEDFWNTVWYNEVKGIVCLNKPSLLAPTAYYETDQFFEKSKLAVKIKATEKEKGFTIREMDLEKNGRTRRVFHFAFTDWPDFGVPDNFEDVSKLIELKNEKMHSLKRQSKGSSATSNLDLLVHCSAGCGRTGCFITLDMVNECFKGNGNGKYDPWGERDLIYKAVQLQRQQRIAMVQTLDQFIYCYESVLHEICKSYI